MTDYSLTQAAAPGVARRRGWRLATHFALLVGVFVLAAAAAVVYVELQARHDGRAAADDDVRFAARTAAAQLGKELTLLRSTVTGLAANPQVAQAITHPQGCTLTFGVGDLGTGHLDILDGHGAVVCSSRKAAGATYAGAPWLGRALRVQLTQAPLRDRATGAEVALVTQPLAGGRGIVAGFLDLTPLAPTLAALYGGGKPLAFLLTTADRRTVVARSIQPGRWIGSSLAGTSFAEATASGKWRDIDGKTRIYAVAPVAATGWKLFVGEQESSALAAATRLERRELWIIVAGLAVFLAAAALVYTRTARPIVQLSAAVRRSRAGPEPEPEPVTAGGPAEVRTLADDVNGLVTAVRRELAERMQAEETLRVSAENYRLLFEHHPAPMWLYDPSTLRFLDVNPAAIAIYGYSRDEFLAMTIEDIRPEEDRDRLRASLEDVAGPDEGTLWRHRKKDGTVIDVMVYANALAYDGQPARVVLAHDVTEQRRLEDQVRQAQKMEAIGGFAGGIAHDFNNLLTVIRGYSSVLLRQVGEPDLQGELRQIDDAANRAAELTRQLLAFSRRQVLRPQLTQVNDVVEETLKLLERVIGEDVTVEADLDPDLAQVLIDPGQFGQVILNLAVNARDAMPAGGRLWIKTANVSLDAAYAAEHVDVTPGPHVLLQITDSGVGMDEATQRRVFDPYFTTKAHGTGLGLATVYGIVKQSGGHIWLYSEPGTGTTFKLYFPSAAGTGAAELEAPPARAASTLRGAETILLVEDDAGVRRLAAEIARSLGYTVHEARTAAEAIAAAEQLDRVDLLLTDVVLPEVSGAELAARIVAARPGTRVLFTSGYPGGTLVQEGVAGARASFLEKPYLPDELARALREVLDRE